MKLYSYTFLQYTLSLNSCLSSLVLPLHVKMAVGLVVSERYGSLRWLIIVSSLQLLTLLLTTLTSGTYCKLYTYTFTHKPHLLHFKIVNVCVTYTLLHAHCTLHINPNSDFFRRCVTFISSSLMHTISFTTRVYEICVAKPRKGCSSISTEHYIPM